MEFLGKLGIDLHLLIAQMINFAILLWILTKLLYKPILKKIEEDEAELRQARVKNQELEEKEIAFQNDKIKTMAEIRKTAQKIIKDAEKIAQEIKEDAGQKIREEKIKIIKQSKNKSKSLKSSVKQEILTSYQSKFINSFQKLFKQELSLSSRREIQDIFWKDLIQNVKKLKSLKLKEPSLINILEKLDSIKDDKDSRQKKSLEKKISRVFAEKIGPLVLEYAYAPSKEQEENLVNIIFKKTGVSLDFIKKQNKNLINGFSFEIAGTVIESNLLNIINNATRSK